MDFKKYIKLLSLILFVIGFSFTTSAQNRYGYDEGDYDGEYDYNNYNNDNYQRYSEDEYRKRQQRSYKKSYNEEDLYNGGYRGKRGNYDNETGYNSGYGGIGGLGVGNATKSNSNSWFGGSNNNDAAPIKPRNIQQFDTREVGAIFGADKLGGNGDGFVDKGADPNKGKEIDPRKVDGGPPGPPDEPDIPVDTAIPFLIVAGVLIAATKMNKIKNALV